MSWKSLLLIILIIIFGIFIYLEVQVIGSPTSRFNQTTRFTLGKYPVLRTIFNLHSYGDARGEYLLAKGPVVIEWFKPAGKGIDAVTLQKFANDVSKYTDRSVEILNGGDISGGTVATNNLPAFELKSQSQNVSGSRLFVLLVQDYSPRTAGELSTTYRESAMILSLNGYDKFLRGYQDDLSKYLLSSMLHEFGNQIGLRETTTGSPDCIMNLHAGINGQPVEVFGFSEPQDFCPAEQQEIHNIKLNLTN